jgi:sulfite exporter TauE/SafE
MSAELQVMIIAAISIAFLHTLAGPDHYLPFIALSRARGWSFSKTIFWTVVCGCGHVWSSVLLGLAAAAVGWSIAKLEWVEGIRGGLAGWALVLFGLLYAAWGLWTVRRGRRHKHFEEGDGELYVYEHTHNRMAVRTERHAVTPWVMFLIFLLGPCEPMMALLFYPAAQQSFGAMVVLVVVYTIFTLLTMVLMVMLGYYGLSFLNNKKLEQYMHPIGGLTILVCGAGMVFLGW